MMSSAQDPFYIVKEEIHDSIEKLESSFRHWEKIPRDSVERPRAAKEIHASCESIIWQVDELDKAIAVAARDPARYNMDEAELESRRRWTSNSRAKVGSVKKSIGVIKDLKGMREELLWASETHHQIHNDEFTLSESERQRLLIKQQDEELDELSESVQRIGGVGLTIHDELVAQEKIIGEFDVEMDTATNRLDFIQKKVGMVMKKASAKGQMMVILFLIGLFLFLFFLVFFT